MGALWYALVPTVAAASVFAAALVGNTNVFSSGNLLLSSTTPDAAVCVSSGSSITNDSANCTGNPLTSATLSTTAVSSTTTLASTGTISATSGLMGSNGCGVQQLSDGSAAGTDPVLPVYGVTLNNAMSTLSSTAAAFDGSTGWGESVKSFANPQTFSIAGWFNTSSAQGTLIGFSSTQTNTTSTSNDRELWIDSTGKLVWATASTSTTISEVTSPTTYWSMTDAGTATYTGLLPSLAATAVKFYDASGHSNTGAAGTGTVTTAASGPLGGTAVTLTGAAGSAVNGASSAASVQTTSQSIWFDTTTSGVLMSRTNLASDGGTATDSDHMLWIDATGHLVYGVAYGSTPTRVEASSPGTYNDGAWHLAVATVSASALTLYVDGQQVATTASVATVQSYTGYWHLGYGYSTSWTDPPSNTYFTGSLAHAAVYATTLSAAQVTSLYTPQSVSTEEYAVLALSPSAYWPLYDKVTSPACATVEVTVGAVKGATTSCVEPYLASTACAAPSTSVEANTLLPKVMPVPISGTTVALSVTLKLTAAEAAGVAGLHLLMPLSLMTQNSNFSSQVTYLVSQAVL